MIKKRGRKKHLAITYLCWTKACFSLIQKKFVCLDIYASSFKNGNYINIDKNNKLPSKEESVD